MHYLLLWLLEIWDSPRCHRLEKRILTPYTNKLKAIGHAVSNGAHHTCME